MPQNMREVTIYSDTHRVFWQRYWGPTEYPSNCILNWTWFQRGNLSYSSIHWKNLVYGLIIVFLAFLNWKISTTIKIRGIVPNVAIKIIDGSPILITNSIARIGMTGSLVNRYFQLNDSKSLTFMNSTPYFS